MRGKKTKRIRRELEARLREFHTFEHAGSERTLKVYDTQHPGIGQALIEGEDTTFEETFLYAMKGPLPAIHLYWDKQPVCGDPDCRVVLVKFQDPAAPQVPFRVGVGAGSGMVSEREFLSQERHHSNPSAAYFQHPCDICRIAYQERARVLLEGLALGKESTHAC